MLEPVEVECPHCGECFPTHADTSEGSYTTVEDCVVCCRPMEIHIVCRPGRVERVEVSAL